MNMKQLRCLFVLFLAWSIQSHAEVVVPYNVPPLKFDETPVLNKHGQIAELEQDIAELTCHERHMRLPTAREFAMLAKQFGAAGLTPWNGENYGIFAQTRVGQSFAVDRFQYDFKGYLNSSIAAGRTVWTANSSGCDDVDPCQSIVFNGYNGALMGSRESTAAFICVSGGPEPVRD